MFLARIMPLTFHSY